MVKKIVAAVVIALAASTLSGCVPPATACGQIGVFC